MERGKKAGRGNDSWYGEVQGNERTKAECSEPDTGMCFARRAERSLDSTRTAGSVARMTYSIEIVPFAVVETTSWTMWQ